ncbi:LysM peptidoglycan-binding domain-containing protein [Agrobacterium rubi]|uniref:5'-nucleotidase C-terminal domain-containing protein n=1 Tax=Agrobacterium rubi TaxID=28099 RepID=UPI0015735477|nr:5'-nucleotidase C-terminal domain-containing protein [Agrobacterium rubi]NTF08399.1 LysM peptidoglycan-binding domain-containing protein [Agrobacterium rubi]NTF20627.1 LysM peptidoglycan-binding domain-containing protein [Agrobacterium rubi]NTF27597.1 LysM peptidoglycan-binding domain-containing protein [Agrobacterium rubi]
MNRILRFGLMTASVVALSAGAALADYQLNILHINDLHSRIEAINKFDSTCSTAEADKKECFGGIARVKSAIDARRTELGANANILVLDAGDQFQGSLFYTQYKSGPVAEFMNGIGFDAMAIGNHEFDDGPAELLKLINAVKFPIISGNTKIADGSELKDKFKGYIIKEMGGQKVAVVSVLATDTNETSSPGDKVTFENEIEYLKGAVKEIQDQGVNKIVVLSHVGYVKDQEIARSVDGIDVIVGGHSHTLLSSTDPKAAGPYPTLVKDPSGVDVPIVTAYAYSKYLGDLTVTFDDNGVVKSTSGAPKLLDASVTPDEAFTKRVAELAAPLEEMKQKEIGTSEAPIDGAREVCRVKECTMGNLVSDALLDRVKDQGITIAIQNGGGLRASIDAGPVTMGEVLTVLPFQNSIATFQIKGVDLVAALENGASQIEEGAGRFVQTAGLKYSFDRSKPAGSRIVSVEVKEGNNFVKLDPEKTYGVVTNNYTRTGGDGFKTFATKAINPYDFGPSLEDAVAAYIGSHSPYKPYTDGRVTDVTPADYVAPPKEAKPATPAAPAPATTAQAPAATTPAAPAPAATAPTTPAPATTTSAPATTPAAAGKYVVARGDSLWKIAAEKYGDGTEWKKIAEANALKRPNHIEVGEELNVPAQ